MLPPALKAAAELVLVNQFVANPTEKKIHSSRKNEINWPSINQFADLRT
jgi:hypothetical protein